MSTLTLERWTHKSGPVDHDADPTYNGNGLPNFWTCHKCGDTLLLDGRGVPIVTPVKARVRP